MKQELNRIYTACQKCHATVTKATVCVCDGEEYVDRKATIDAMFKVFESVREQIQIEKGMA